MSKDISDCTKCSHSIHVHYINGCAYEDCECDRTFGSRVEKSCIGEANENNT